MALKSDLCVVVALIAALSACRDKSGTGSDSARGSLPPVYPSSPLENTHWDSDAGPVMIFSTGGGDSAAVILPEATDSTIASFQGIVPPVAGLTFDLFARAGKVGAAVPLSLIAAAAPKTDCYSWPLAKIKDGATTGWRVGLLNGRATAIRLDSIEARSSTDSAALAASLAQTAAALPAASDPAFRGLPFRVRSAYTFHIDSTEIVLADVVRTVNEEANPRVEHLFIVGGRPVGTVGKFSADYFSRAAGAEDKVQATDVLAVVRMGPEKRAVIIVNIEFDEGARLGLIERAVTGEWSATWMSAYTDC
jgi:hypothetical protein